MNNKLKRCCFALLFFYNTLSSQNCNYIFSGKIEDFHENSVLTEATIFIKELNIFSIADSKGEFTISNLCKGIYTIEIAHVACENVTAKITINQNVYKTFQLEHHLEELKEIVFKIDRKTSNTSIEQTLKEDVIESFTDKSLGDVLAKVTGVSSLSTGNSIVKPMIHGLHSSRLLIVNNNVRQFDQEWGIEHGPSIDINTASSIDVIKGANTLLYGSDAIAGLVLIKRGNYQAKDSLFGSSSSSLNSNGRGGNISAEVVTTSKKGFYNRMQVNYKKFGDFKAAKYNLSNSGVKNLNASLSFGYKSFEKGFDLYYSYVDNTIGIIRTAHVGNVNDLIRAINKKAPSFVNDFSYEIDNPRQLITHHLAKLQAYKRFQNLGKLTLQYDFQINRRKEFDRRRTVLRDNPAADFRLFTTSFQSNLKIDALKNLVINTGFLLRYQQNNSADANVTRVRIPLIPSYDKYETGFYVVSNYNLSAQTKISAGFRYDLTKIEAEKKYKVFDWEENNYDELFPEFTVGVEEDFEILTFPKFNFNNYSASFGFTSFFNQGYEFSFNYGLASRTPNASELFSNGLHHSAARIETGSLLLHKEIANKFIASFTRNHQVLGFSISPYYNSINNFIQLIPAGDALTTVRGAFIEWKYSQVDARIFGVDLDVNGKLTDKLYYTGSLGVLQGDNLTEDIPLIHMPSTNFSNALFYTNKEFYQLNIGITQQTEFRQSSFPDYNFTTFNPINQEDVLVDISSTTGAFTLFHFNSSASFKFAKKSSLTVAFNIENIFNKPYRNYLNTLRYFADDLGRNFNIKLKYNY